MLLFSMFWLFLKWKWITGGGAFLRFRGYFQGKMVGTADSEDFSFPSKCTVQILVFSLTVSGRFILTNHWCLSSVDWGRRWNFKDANSSLSLLLSQPGMLQYDEAQLMPNCYLILSNHSNSRGFLLNQLKYLLSLSHSCTQPSHHTQFALPI